MSKNLTPANSRLSPKASGLSPIRCAIYTRKSTEERLDLEFNSLDAQRDAAESFIASQKSEGWVCLPKRYDDGGFSGGNLDRPANNELMKDIEAGEVDDSLRCVVDDTGVRRAILEQSERLLQQQQQRHELQLRQLTAQRSRDELELKRTAFDGESGDLIEARRQDLRARLDKIQVKIAEVEKALEHLQQCRFGPSDVEDALSDFDGLWAILRARGHLTFNRNTLRIMEGSGYASDDTDRPNLHGATGRNTRPHQGRVRGACQTA